MPTLHTSLGVFKKLYDLFEKACHGLDLQLFRMRVSVGDAEQEQNNFADEVAAEVQRHQQIQDKFVGKVRGIE